MVEIGSKDEFETWLRRQPRGVAVALAARAALRVLPLLKAAKASRGFRSNIVLPVFRAAAVSWAAANYPARERELAGAASAATFAPFTGAASTTASAAVETAAFAPFFDVFDPAAFTAPVFAAAGTSAFQRAISADAELVDDGAAPSAIASLPLWPNEGQPVELQSFWEKLKRGLLEAGEDWNVWTDWYEDRLQGRVREESHELSYVQIKNALWDQGAAVVNAEIRRRIKGHETLQDVVHLSASTAMSSAASASIGIAEHAPPLEAIPEQSSAATIFRTNQQGLIDVVPDPPAAETFADPLQQEIYAEVRAKAEDLLGLGSNQLGDLTDPTSRFLESLPAQIEEVSITRSWSRANTLRRRLRAHELAAQSGEPDPARLTPLVAETLRDLVDTWNVFVIGDARGRELDEIRLGPQEAETAKGIVTAAAPLVEAILHSENIATPLAIDAVAEQANAAKSALASIDGDQATELSRKTTSNFVIQLVGSAYALVRNESSFVIKEIRAGVYRAAGAAAFSHLSPYIFDFIARHAEALKDFAEVAWHNPAVTKIIELIAKMRS